MVIMIPRRKIDIQTKDLTLLLKYLFQKNDASKILLFKRALSEYFNNPDIHLTSSGRGAMIKALELAGIPRGSLIAVPAYTLGELIPLLLSCSFIPVPVDVNMLPGHLESRFAEHDIKAVICLHAHGVACDVQKINSICKDHCAILIEDCAHSMGGRTNGKLSGTVGNFSFFSFETNKALPTFGGGMVMANQACGSGHENHILDYSLIHKAFENMNKEILSTEGCLIGPVIKKTVKTLAEEALIRSPLYAVLAPILFHPMVIGWFERFYRSNHSQNRRQIGFYSSLQAETGLYKIDFLDLKNKLLEEKRQYYETLLPPSLIPQKSLCTDTRVPYNMTARYVKGDITGLRLRAYKYGIDIGIHSEVMDDCSKMLMFDDCPNVAALYNQVVLLPFFPSITKEEIKRIAAVLRIVC
jgi:dTDP-4-amino-4,6-dideoxygalactose transaminase